MKLVDMIREDIADKRIVKNGKLPTLRELAAHYKCGATTVKRAFDELAKNGIIRVVRGKGNFVLDSHESYYHKRTKSIGAILLNGVFMSELAAVRDRYLNEGWLFSIYDATLDHQSPEKERLFLQNAAQHNFASVIISASPIEPVNTELFMQLRADGCKVIHISPYIEDMSEECYFMHDQSQFAELAVWKIAAAGYKNIIYIGREHTAPHVLKTEKGLFNALSDSGLKMIDSFTVHHKESDAVMDCLRNIPHGTAILSFDTEVGEIVQWCASRIGLEAPADFGLISMFEVFGVNAGHSYIIGNIRKMVEDVLDYAVDETRSPFERVQKTYRGTFVDLKTL